MKKISSILLIIGSLLCCLASCGHEHVWSNATCTTPKTCYNCGETEGDVNEHSFGAWQETVKGDCYTISSEQKRICYDCQYEETKTLSPSHNYSNGVCTKCEKPLIENMTLGDDVRKYKATLMNKENVSVYGITWKDIVAAETPNTYHCKIGFSVYQYDYSSYIYEGDYVDLKYVITDSSDNIVLEKTVSCMLSGGSVSCTTFYTSEISRFNFEFDITLDPNETYLFSIKIIGGI